MTPVTVSAKATTARVIGAKRLGTATTPPYRLTLNVQFGLGQWFVEQFGEKSVRDVASAGDEADSRGLVVDEIIGDGGVRRAGRTFQHQTIVLGHFANGATNFYLGYKHQRHVTLGNQFIGNGAIIPATRQTVGDRRTVDNLVHRRAAQAVIERRALRGLDAR